MNRHFYSEINYWKAHDLFIIQHDLTSYGNRFEVQVFSSYHKPQEYHVVQPVFDPSSNEWIVKTAVYTEEELDQWKYWRFHGMLDGSDYLTGDEETQEEIDLFILARSEEEAITLSGYPVESHAHWNWMYAPPSLTPFHNFDDEVKVIGDRIQRHIFDADFDWILEEWKEWEVGTL